jgi:hypothetical protein
MFLFLSQFYILPYDEVYFLKSTFSDSQKTVCWKRSLKNEGRFSVSNEINRSEALI